jgi:sugar lactone lactonase YvrE
MKRLIFSVLLSILGFSLLVTSSFAGYNTSSNLPADYKNIGVPRDIVVLSSGSYWYADSLGNRIVKVSSGGSIQRTVGKYGTGDGEFANPRSLARDNNGNLYVMDTDNNRVQKLDSNGGFITSWGNYGSGDGEFANPLGITYDAFSDSIYVSDQNNWRVQKFTTNGTYIAQFGSYGSGYGQFDEPHGITTDSVGKIYVVNTNNHRVDVFNSNLTYSFSFGSTDGLSPEYLLFPKDVVVLSTGEIVVTSQNSNQVKKFSSSGVYISNITTGGSLEGQSLLPEYIARSSSNDLYISDWSLNSIQRIDSNGNFISTFQNNGVAIGKFTYPNDVAFDSEGLMYVFDKGNGRVEQYTNSGTYISSFPISLGNPWHMSIDSSDRIFISDDTRVTVYDTTGTTLFTIGSFGTGDGEFDQPRGIGFDTSGNIYVADLGNNRIEKFNSSGVYQSQWGSTGEDDGQFNWPEGVAVDSNNNVFVTDYSNKVQKFTSGGAFVTRWGGSGTADGQFGRSYSIAIDSADNVYITDMSGNSFEIFDNDGNFLHRVGKYGSGINEFVLPAGIAINPLTGAILVADAGNHRVESIALGTRIQNLISSADVLRVADSVSLVKQMQDPSAPGSDSIGSELYFGEYLVSDLTVDLTLDRDWGNVGATSVPDGSKALLVNLNPVDAPGASATHSLYIVKGASQTSVYVCPNAVLLSEVTQGCAGGYQLDEGAANLSTVNVNGVDYWKIDGLTGTGALGLSIIAPTGRLTLNPNSSAVSATQEVTITYTPSAGFVSSDRIQLYFEPTAGFVLANTCGTPTEDADGDSTVDGAATIVGNDVYEYTFSDTVAAGPLSFCAVVTSPATAGSYSVRLTDDNGNFDNAMYYVGDDNDVFVIANVAPSLSFNIRTLDDSSDTNVCEFGTISASDTIPDYDIFDDGTSECGYSLAIGTNATGGFQVQVSANHELASTSANISTLSNGGSFVAGVEAYGLASVTAAASGRNTLTGVYNQSVTRDGNFNLATSTGTNIPLVPTNFVSYDNGIEYLASSRTDDITSIIHGLVIGSGTPAGYYQQVLTYTVTANF